MREKWPKQMPLMSHILDHSQSKELEVISGIIDANPTICEHILQDLNRGKSAAQRAGAKGMSAEQVLRCLVVKILFGFTYEDLALGIGMSPEFPRIRTAFPKTARKLPILGQIQVMSRAALSISMIRLWESCCLVR